MADLPPALGSGADPMRQQRPGPTVPPSVSPRPAEATAGPPRWVKVFGIIGLAVVLLIVVMLLTGHGPGRHMHSGLRGHNPSAGLALGGVAALDEHLA
jgi:hypothetical protein